MAADVVVLASPMYYWSISGQLKCAFDRLFAVAELGPDLANPVKDAVLLMAAEGDTEENFAPVRAYYKALLDCLGWKDAGIVYAGGNMRSAGCQTDTAFSGTSRIAVCRMGSSLLMRGNDMTNILTSLV